MKYEVIGWTELGDETIPQHPCVTACVENAIRRELQAGGYCFGGDMHEEYCPVLNDGTYVSLSWRGWGGVMARARGEFGDMDYMHYYMNALIDPSVLKYPRYAPIDRSRILPRETLAETFSMHLRGDLFEAMRAGRKTVELRLFDEKRKRIDFGDYVEFCRADDPSQTLKRKVIDLDVDRSFRALIRRIADSGKQGGSAALRLGFPEGTSLDGLEEEMKKIYSEERVKETGALALYLSEC